MPSTRTSYTLTGYLADSYTIYAAPVVFWRFGKRIREASRFAKFSVSTYRDNRVEDDMNESEGEAKVASPA